MTRVLLGVLVVLLATGYQAAPVPDDVARENAATDKWAEVPPLPDTVASGGAPDAAEPALVGAAPAAHSPSDPTTQREASSNDGVSGETPAEDRLQEPPLEIKMFHLQNIPVRSGQVIIEQLYRDGVQASVDERTGSLIVRGGKEKLAEIEAILLRLEEPELGLANSKLDAPQRAYADNRHDLPAGLSVPADSIDVLRRQYTAAERRACELARL